MPVVRWGREGMENWERRLNQIVAAGPKTAVQSQEEGTCRRVRDVSNGGSLLLVVDEFGREIASCEVFGG